MGKFTSPNNRSTTDQRNKQNTQNKSVQPYGQQQRGQSNREQTKQQDHRYEPTQGGNGMVMHRPYHYPTDDRPWAFGPPVYQDEWGNPTNVPVSNLDRAKDMGVDMLEGGMRGMFYAGFRYLERRIFQS